MKISITFNLSTEELKAIGGHGLPDRPIATRQQAIGWIEQVVSASMETLMADLEAANEQ